MANILCMAYRKRNNETEKRRRWHYFCSEHRDLIDRVDVPLEIVESYDDFTDYLYCGWELYRAGRLAGECSTYDALKDLIRAGLKDGFPLSLNRLRPSDREELSARFPPADRY